MNDREMESKMVRQVGAVSAVIWVLYWIVVVKRELRGKTKLSTKSFTTAMSFGERHHSQKTFIMREVELRVVLENDDEFRHPKRAWSSLKGAS